jgi:1D-myo-inositol-tetrakisphosphate 5-kinase/inositol-polyphosphate multikinase
MDSGAELAVAEQPKPVFKVAANQVAGHRFEEGRVGSLVDDSGRFYKPLQTGARGDKETQFYDKIWSDTAVPPAVKAFFPHFYGTIDIDAPDGSSINILQSPIFSSSNPNCFVWGF